MEDMLTLEEKCRGNDHQMMSDMKQSLSILPTFSLFWALLVRFFFHQKNPPKTKNTDTSRNRDACN